MIISQAKKWSIITRRYGIHWTPCGLCQKDSSHFFIINTEIFGGITIAICTRCMKQINKATTKYFDEVKDEK